MANDPDDEIQALRAALREARWQSYHLFNVQRQRAHHAAQREKDLVRLVRAHVKALQRARKIAGELDEAVTAARKSLAGLVGAKRMARLESLLAKNADWLPEVPDDLLDLDALPRPEDADEALAIPFQTPTVDLVICVHNALDDVKACLHSVEERSPRVQQIILVNDGSDEETAAWLDHFAGTTLIPTEVIHNLEPRGYTIAANQGMRRSPADYVILLNSDTIVTHNWVETILQCGESDEKIGILGPLSNAASWQSVPERFGANGDWEVNELPEGISPDDVASRLLLEHEPHYPRVGLVNGFCIVIKRSVFNEIGYFDEETFPRGYGEENDFCLRAGEAGFDLAIVDNGYIFHAKSKSFTHERRRELSKNATKLLHQKHGQEKLDAACAILKDDPDLARARETFARIQTEKVPFRILFLMDFKGEGGGTHSIAQECEGLCRLGIFAQMAIRDRHAAFYAEKYPDHRASRFHAYHSDHELAAYAGTFDLVVATLFTSVDLLKRVVERYPHVVPAYYIQDYEPLFYEEEDPLRHRAKASYTAIPGMICFAKTRWLCDTVSKEEQVEMHKVTPSIDHGVYTPPDTPQADDPLTVCAMVRPSTPRRSPELTVEILGELKQEFGDKIRVVVFGADADDPFWKDHPLEGENRGVLAREGVAGVLREASLFLDLSTYQAFGRTGLEAMACGCVPILPEEGGAGEYAKHRENAYLVDTADKEAILTAAREFLRDGILRGKLRKQALETAAKYTVEAATKSERDLFQSVIQG